MKKFVKVAIVLMALLCLMFAEYRYIMTHITPYRGENGAVYLEVFGQVDEYDYIKKDIGELKSILN